jgi:succinate dehydrogenase subunit D
MAYKQPIEPFLWLLFSAGGTLAAMALPILVFILGLAVPLGWIDPPSFEYLHRLVHNPLARLAIFALTALGLLHWAHRFRYTLYDGLQIKHLNEMIDISCYGGAILISLVAGYLLIT